MSIIDTIIRYMNCSKNAKKVTINMVWLLFDKFIKTVLGLIVGVWVARFLGPHDFGKWNFVQGIIAVFVPLATLALDSIIIRDIICESERVDEILGTAFVLRIFGGFIAYLLSIICILVLKPDDKFFITITLILSLGLFLSAFEVINYWFQSQVLSKYIVISGNIAILLSSFVKILLILYKAKLIYFIIATTIESIINITIIIILYYKKGNNIFSWKFRLYRGIYLLRNCWPLVLSQSASIIYSKIDQIMIGGMMNDYSVGIYSASAKIYDLCLSVDLVIVTSIYPVMVQWYYSNKNKFIERYKIITSLFTFLSYLVFIIISIFGNQIITLLLGIEYKESYSVLVIQSLGLIFMFNAALRSNYLFISSNEKLIFYTSILAAIMNIALNICLIPIYGIQGAAIATVITQACSLLLSNVLFKELHMIFKIQLKGFLLYDLLIYYFDKSKIKK